MTVARVRKSLQVRTAASAVPPAQVDEFEILRPLGQGSMGQVYQARDTVLGRPVAVKFLATDSPTPAARKRFLTEARAIARVQHPNILSIYRVGICGERPYIAGEFLSGNINEAERSDIVRHACPGRTGARRPPPPALRRNRWRRNAAALGTR